MKLIKEGETTMVKRKTHYLTLLFPILAIGFLLINEGYSQRIPQETDDAKAFKVLKAKISI